jgi:hypothetical protein
VIGLHCLGEALLHEGAAFSSREVGAVGARWLHEFADLRKATF